MGPIFTLDDVLDMMRRRWMVIFVVTGLGALVSVGVALQRDHVYESSEVIQIAQPRISGDLASTTVEGSSARRLQLIEQRLMTRGSLLEVIATHGLFADLPALTDSEKVDLLRQSVSIVGVAAAREGFTDDGSISVVTVTALLPNPVQAQQVARDLAGRTIRLSREARIEQSRETLEFLTQQENEIATAITEMGAQIAEYRRTHDLALPGSVETSRDTMLAIERALLDLAQQKVRLEREIADIDERLRAATAARREDDLRKRIDTLDDQRDMLLRRRDEVAKSLETTPQIEQELGAFERQMSQLQDQFEIISARRAEAEIGFRLESRAHGEHLTVIEPASVADYPSTPSRKRTVILGTVMGLLAGFGLAFLLDYRNPVIRTAAQLQRETGHRAFASVPHLDVRRKSASRGGWLRRLFGRGVAKNSS